MSDEVDPRIGAAARALYERDARRSVGARREDVWLRVAAEYRAAATVCVGAYRRAEAVQMALTGGDDAR